MLNTSLHAATKLLGLKSHKFTFVHNLQEADGVARVGFCNWFCESVCSGEVDLLLNYLTAKSRSYSEGHVSV
jgi:hypothetical protein